MIVLAARSSRRQALHQGAGAQSVRPVVGEVGFTGDIESGNAGLQVVVDPEPTHRVVHGRIDPHWCLVRVLACDLGVHVEEVAVLGFHGCSTEPRYRVSEVEVNPQPAGADTAPFVADVLGSTRRRCRAAPGCQRTDRSAPGNSRDRSGISRGRACPPRSSAPRSCHRCAATRSSRSTWTGVRRSPECTSGGSG